MAIQVNTNFIYQGPLPLDARLRFNTIEERDSFDPSGLYEGIVSYVDGKYYEWTRDEEGTLAWRDHMSVQALTDEEVQEVLDALSHEPR